LVAIAATLAQMQKNQAERDAVIMQQSVQQQVGNGIDWQDVDKRNKAMTKGQQRIVAPAKTAKSFTYQMP
jgi:hypothetical protein